MIIGAEEKNSSNLDDWEDCITIGRNPELIRGIWFGGKDNEFTFRCDDFKILVGHLIGGDIQ